MADEYTPEQIVAAALCQHATFGEAPLPHECTSEAIDREHGMQATYIVAALRRADLLAARASEPAALDALPPPGTRLILVADDLFDLIDTRTDDGRRLTYEWGEPDEHGWYSPVVTAHDDPEPDGPSIDTETRHLREQEAADG